MRSCLLAIALAVAVPFAGAAGADELADGFTEADVNGDGALNADKYLAAVVTAFAARDTDRDGFLTPEELPEAPAEAPARIDRNGDGVISVGEGAADRIVRFFDADTTDASALGRWMTRLQNRVVGLTNALANTTDAEKRKRREKVVATRRARPADAPALPPLPRRR